MNQLLRIPFLLLAALGSVAACGGGQPAGGSGGGTAEGPDPLRHASEAELHRMVSYLASDELQGREDGSPGGELARLYIIEELKRCGVQPALGDSYEQPITTGAGVNILGLIPGTDQELAARHVVISAHYDHQGPELVGALHNGADDNAAGVAIAIGLACALVEDAPRRSVLFAAWDAEEPPTFLTDRMGSEYYAENPVVPLAQTDAVLVLELVGSDLWPSFPAHFVVGAELSPQVAHALAAAPVPAGLLTQRVGLHLVEEQPTGHQVWSDYDAFRNRQVPALMFSNGQTKRYHTPEDDIDTLNFPKMVLEAAYVRDVLLGLANADETPVFDGQGADYLLDAEGVRMVLDAALAPDGLCDFHALNAASRSKLEQDLIDASTIAEHIAQGQAPSAEQIRRLRDGTQRVMCLAGSSYPESMCGLF